MDYDEFLEWLEAVPWFDIELWGNTAARWLTAGIVVLIAWTVLGIVFRIVRSRLERFAAKTTTRWDDGLADALDATRNWFLLLVSVVITALTTLHISEDAEAVLKTVVILGLLLQSALWGSRLLKSSIENYMAERREHDPALATTVSALSFLGNLVLWAIVLLVALDNLGIDVTAMVAGLGVGGIAVALAAQNILGDLFASLSIVLDKPFVLGDFIIVGDMMGTVEKVGLKTTRVRSISGEQLVVANTDLLQSRIRNYKRMYERRIVFSIGVLYETPKEKLKAIPGMIQQSVEAQPQTRFDRAHFKDFGDFSLNFETVYYVLEPDYALYMDIQQAINLSLFEQFADAGIEFAYPTQKLFVEQTQEET